MGFSDFQVPWVTWALNVILSAHLGELVQFLLFLAPPGSPYVLSSQCTHAQLPLYWVICSSFVPFND